MLAMTAVLCLCADWPLTRNTEPNPTGQVARAELGEFVVRAGGVTFNNFCLAEAAPEPLRTGSLSPQPKVLGTLTVRGTFRNPTAERAVYTVVVYGLTADGEVEWACQLAGLADAEKVGVLGGVVPVHPGTLKNTTTIKVRARVAPLPPDGSSVPTPTAPRGGAGRPARSP